MSSTLRPIREAGILARDSLVGKGRDRLRVEVWERRLLRRIPSRCRLGGIVWKVEGLLYLYRVRTFSTSGSRS